MDNNDLLNNDNKDNLKGNNKKNKIKNTSKNNSIDNNDNNDDNCRCKICNIPINKNVGRYCKKCRKEKYRNKNDKSDNDDNTDLTKYLNNDGDNYSENDNYNDYYNDYYNGYYNYNDNYYNNYYNGNNILDDNNFCPNCNNLKEYSYHKYCRECHYNYILGDKYKYTDECNDRSYNNTNNKDSKNINKNNNQNTNNKRKNENTHEPRNTKKRNYNKQLIIEFDIPNKNKKSNDEKTDEQLKEEKEIIDFISSFFEKDKIKESNKRKAEDDIEEESKKYENLEYEYKWLGGDIKNLKDLITLGKSFKGHKRIRHNLNLYKLNKLVEPLEEINNMVGLEGVKNNLFDQIIYYLQGLDDKNTDMLHTVIQGPPGVGKTKLCNILAKVYKGFGFLKNSKVVSVKRDDLIAGYLGQTAIKTRKKIEEALGGVLFIDEAYSLGSEDGKDSFSKEAIDLLTSYLSEHPHDLICIIAGYKESLEKCFFNQNEGLKRRFTQVFTIDGYNYEELKDIFCCIVKDNGWVINNDISVDFFKDKKDYFLYNGGDMLNLFACCKKAHSKRLLLIAEDENKLLDSKKIINMEDIKNGFEIFINNPDVKKRGEKECLPSNMYS